MNDQQHWQSVILIQTMCNFAEATNAENSRRLAIETSWPLFKITCEIDFEIRPIDLCVRWKLSLISQFYKYGWNNLIQLSVLLKGLSVINWFSIPNFTFFQTQIFFCIFRQNFIVGKNRIGDKSFYVSAPSLWNSLPRNIREACTLSSFKKVLKSHLYPSYWLCFAVVYFIVLCFSWRFDHVWKGA